MPEIWFTVGEGVVLGLELFSWWPITGFTISLRDVVLFQGCNQNSCTLGTELHLTMFRCLRKAIKFLRQSDSQLKLGLRRRGPWERGSWDLKITEC